MRFKMPKQMTSFRLSDAAKDQLQECLEILRRQHDEEGRHWMLGELNRTLIVERAIASYFTALKNAELMHAQERREQEAKRTKLPTKKGRKK